MKFAIIAAGEGSRLAREGVDLPKPLVTVGGEPMIERLARIFMKWCGGDGDYCEPSASRNRGPCPEDGRRWPFRPVADRGEDNAEFDA